MADARPLRDDDPVHPQEAESARAALEQGASNWLCRDCGSTEFPWHLALSDGTVCPAIKDGRRRIARMDVWRSDLVQWRDHQTELLAQLTALEAENARLNAVVTRFCRLCGVEPTTGGIEVVDKALEVRMAEVAALRQDAERWRAVAPTLVVVSIGPRTGNYLTGEYFIENWPDGKDFSAETFADIQRAALSPPAQSEVGSATVRNREMADG